MRGKRGGSLLALPVAHMNSRSEEGSRMKAPLNTRSPESRVTPEHFLLVLLIVLAIALFLR